MAEQPSDATIDQMHRWFAVECNNATWELIEKQDRTEQDNREMLYEAYASAYHWSQVGTELNDARAEMNLSYVHSLLGLGEFALGYGRACLDFFENNDCEDWDLAFAHAAMAYAAAVVGDAELHARHYSEAELRGKTIADEIDRGIFFGVFVQVPDKIL